MVETTRRGFVQGAALGGIAAAMAGIAVSDAAASEGSNGAAWDYEADVVVVGAGGSGLPAALTASDAGASVIVVEANWDCGGHAAVSGGCLGLGGGVANQVDFGIEDSSDAVYLDHTKGEYTISRLSDRAVVRAIADMSSQAYEYIVEKGVIVKNKPADNLGGFNECDSVPRWTFADISSEGWEPYWNRLDDGVGVTRPLERAAREAGVQFLMNYHMDTIFREQDNGRVTGIEASYTPHVLPGQTEPLVNLMTDGNIACTSERVRIKANRGVVIATGGSIGNLEFRLGYDPRLGPEFDGLAGMPFSNQDASGEIAAMRVGAVLGDMANFMQMGGHQISMAKRVGCRYGYAVCSKTSVLWPLFVAMGVARDPDSMIVVNMLGQRCGNEDVAWSGDQTAYPYYDTALSSVVIDDPAVEGDALRLGGPLWAIFDQAAVDRNGWDVEQGGVDYANGYCFKADTLEELAQKVVNKYYEDIKMDPQTLVNTVAAYNTAVDTGVDEEWGRTHLVYKIEQGPFYCAWSTPNLHDCYGGLRVDDHMQCVDVEGNMIAGLYACGESAAGVRTHGLMRAIPCGMIAGRSVVEGSTRATLMEVPAGWNEMSFYADPVTPDDLPKLEVVNVGDAPAADGMFEGTSPNGIGGQLTLVATMADGQLSAIEITRSGETGRVGGIALDLLIPRALEGQTNAIDGLAGATVTCRAFCEALGMAIKRAQE